MPDKLADHRKRVSFAEDIEVVEAMKALAISEKKTLTDVYAEAARILLARRASIRRKSKQ